MKYGDTTIFTMAVIAILDFQVLLSHLTVISREFCIVAQNMAIIGQCACAAQL